MPKSSRFQPGDSAPDFSHLADHDPESDEPQWSAGGDDSTAGADDDAPAEAPPASAGTPPPPEDAPGAAGSGTGAGDSPVGDSHVFFETERPLSEQDLAGETTAYTPPHQEPATGAGEPSATNEDSDSVLNAAPDADDRPRKVSTENATQLTDVGIPAFVDPPDPGDAAGNEDPPAAAGTADDDPAGEQAASAPSFVPAPSAPAADQRPAPASPAAPKARPASRSARSAASSPPPDTDRQRLLLILLASYASAMTIGFLWLWLARNNARPHELESLPDVAPLGPNEFRYAPQEASMPNGHTLPLGSQQQLGHIRVEPLRVTRGPVQFAHFSDPAQAKPATEPVLKLWLRFTNVSSDQLIAPLDANLLLTRSYQVETDSVLANQLLLPADKTSQKPAFVIDHPTTSEWDLAGQKLGHRLAPGESLETYIPLEPGSDAHLRGDLLWRVHFRKGYHDPTGHGVTTMIEVPFSTADVQTEATAS